jgi:tRNA 2-thiouridine synthesizing protein A
MNSSMSAAPAWALEADDHLDTTGLRCPEPLMLLRNRVRGLVAGARLHVTATDPASVRDFEQFCRMLGHSIEARAEVADRFDFLIEKGGGGKDRGA